MTVKYLVKMLNPELDIIIYKCGEPMTVFKAKDAEKSIYAEKMLKNWKACKSRPMFRIDI
jgi:hypothetical protein